MSERNTASITLPDSTREIDSPVRFNEWLRTVRARLMNRRDNAPKVEDPFQEHPNLLFATDREIAHYARKHSSPEDQRYTVWELATMRW